jgi:hypothetical protein
VKKVTILFLSFSLLLSNVNIALADLVWYKKAFLCLAKGCVDAIAGIAPAALIITPGPDAGVTTIALEHIKLRPPSSMFSMTLAGSSHNIPCIDIYPINFLMKLNFDLLLNSKIDKLMNVKVKRDLVSLKEGLLKLSVLTSEFAFDSVIIDDNKMFENNKMSAAVVKFLYRMLLDTFYHYIFDEYEGETSARGKPRKIFEAVSAVGVLVSGIWLYFTNKRSKAMLSDLNNIETDNIEMNKKVENLCEERDRLLAKEGTI